MALVYSCTKDIPVITFEVYPPEISYGMSSDYSESDNYNDENYDSDNEDYEGESESVEEAGSDDVALAFSSLVNTDLDNVVYDTPILKIYANVNGSSATNIDLLETVITSGITIQPAIAGSWRWADTNMITFVPAVAWQPATEYIVTMSPEIFQKDLVKAKQTVKFTTPAFESQIASYGLSRAPGEERTPRFVVVAEFSVPVDEESFEKSAKMTLDGKAIKVLVSYDDKKRRAVLTSEPISIISNTQKLVFTAENFLAQNSKVKTISSLREAITVPDYNDLFYIKDVNYKILRDKQNVPQQVLFLEFTDGVNREVVEDGLELYLLPDNNYSDFLEDIQLAVDSKSSFKKVPVKKAPSEGLADFIHPFMTDISKDKTSYMLVIFDKKIESASGFPLKKSYRSIVRVPRYPQELSIASDGAILPLYGDKILTFTSRGVSDVTIDVGQLVDDNQLQNIIQATYNGGLKEIDFKWDVNEYTFVDEIKTQNFKYNIKSAKEQNYSSIDLGSVLKNSGVGLFFVKAYSKNSNVSSVKRLILITDMGIITKKDLMGNTSVFVMSLTNQTPVEGARVDVIGKNGISVYSGYTSTGGVATLPNLSDLRNEKSPTAIVVKKGRDISFIPLNKYMRDINTSRFDVGGVSESEESVRSFLFSDRGIYRPGEKVSIGAIVKQPDWRSLAGVAVRVSINDPAGKNIYKKIFSLTDDGMFDFEYQTETVSPTGYYEVDVYRMENNKSDRHLGSMTFKVEEFEADTMRIKTSIAGKPIMGWQKPDMVSGYVKVENMFGTPASDRRVRWLAEVMPVTFAFGNLDGYKFTDPNLDKTGNIRKVFTPSIPDGRTDANGEATADLNLNSMGNGSFLLVLEGEGFEPGSGRSVIAGDKTYVSNLDYLVGYKSTGNLSFLKRNSDHSVEFIAVNNKLQKIALNNLKYRLKNINYVMSLVKTKNGTYTYQSVEKQTTVDEGSFSIGDAGVDYPLPTRDAGRFVFEIFSPDGAVIGRVPFFVSGSTNLETGVEKNAELVVQLNKTQYLPGETIEVNIIAPYVGAGLITIERDKIYAYEWFRTTTSSSVQKITLPTGIEGNAYVNVSFIRDPSSKEIFITPYSYGIAPFAIDAAKRTVKIDLSVPALTVPGEELKVKYSADKDARLILFGADEGILQVAGYSLPNPLAFFMQKKELKVYTSQTVDLMIPDYRIIKEAFAAGGGEDAIAKRLNPFARKTFKPAVFWSKIVDVKAGESYEYNYLVPEYFNGTIKVMAVSSSLNAVGSASVPALARSPIVMVVNNPLAATSGDSFKVSVGVTNNIEGVEGASDIKLTAVPSDHLEMLSEATQTISVPSGGERTVVYDIKVKKDVVGAAQIVWTAENPALAKAVKSTGTMSIRPETNYKSTLGIGSFKTDKTEITTGFRTMYDAYAKRTTGVSSNPLAVLTGMTGYLMQYPHGCSEQIVSKIFPLLYMAKVSTDGEYINMVRRVHGETVAELRKRQVGSDGFSLWANYRSLNDFVGVYAMHYLIDAKELGFSVPEDMLSNGLRFLSAMSMSEPKSLEDAQVKAYGAYLLARSGVVVSRQLNALEEYLNAVYKTEWKQHIISSYIGATYILMRETSKGEDLLLKGYKIAKDKVISYGDYDNTAIRNSVFLYLVAKHAPAYLPSLGGLASDILTGLSDGWLNTITTANAIISIGAYPMEASSDAGRTVTAFKGKDSSLVTFTENSQNVGEFPSGTDKIAIAYPQADKNMRFYYVLQSGYDKAAPAQVAKGIEITKDYLDIEGNKITSISQGDEMVVRIRVRLTDKNIPQVRSLAITDLLPGGIEPMRAGAKLGENFDLREDRVLIYSSLYESGQVKEFTYRAKALSVGTFKIPPVYGEDMYRLSVYGNSTTGTLTIKEVE